MTQYAIDSLHESEKLINFRVIVVESYSKVHQYKHAIVMKPDQEFNYNAFMNIGIKAGSAEWVCMANNDVVFGKNWFSAILKASEALPHVDSFSSFTSQALKALGKEQAYYVQYGIGTFVTGWCLTAKRKIFEKVKLDERVSFWCSDNVYQDELIRQGVNHALVRDSIVEHLGGRTLFSMPGEKIGELTAGQAQIYAELPKP
jgi:GT2 family glycosyltransferase